VGGTRERTQVSPSGKKTFSIKKKNEGRRDVDWVWGSKDKIKAYGTAERNHWGERNQTLSLIKDDGQWGRAQRRMTS